MKKTVITISSVVCAIALLPIACKNIDKAFFEPIRNARRVARAHRYYEEYVKKEAEREYQEQEKEREIERQRRIKAEEKAAWKEQIRQREEESAKNEQEILKHHREIRELNREKITKSINEEINCKVQEYNCIGSRINELVVKHRSRTNKKEIDSLIQRQYELRNEVIKLRERLNKIEG